MVNFRLTLIEVFVLELHKSNEKNVHFSSFVHTQSCSHEFE